MLAHAPPRAMARVANTLGIPLGRFTDVAAFDEVNRRAWARLPTDDHKKQLGTALNGHGYRARAADKHARSFQRLFRTEPAATPGTRFLQEDALFAVVTNVAAAAETLAFAAYVAALGLQGTTLDRTNLRPSFGDMLATIQSVPETEVLGWFLSSAFCEPASTWVGDVRDVLVHRGMLSRSHYAGGPHHGTVRVARKPKATPAVWQLGVALNRHVLDPACEWLSHVSAVGLPLLADALA